MDISFAMKLSPLLIPSFPFILTNHLFVEVSFLLLPNCVFFLRAYCERIESFSYIHGDKNQQGLFYPYAFKKSDNLWVQMYPSMCRLIFPFLFLQQSSSSLLMLLVIFLVHLSICSSMDVRSPKPLHNF